MEPDEYQQARREVWATATRLVEQLGLLIFWVITFLVSLWLLWQYWDWIVRKFDISLTRFLASSLWVSAAVAWLIRHERIRRGVALAGAVGTLAVGAPAGVFQLDRGWWQRTGRFWCRTPAELERVLRSRVEVPSARTGRRPAKSKSGRRRRPR
ncbi:hypothetical protein FTUN_6582 [Frigoriglobus tundricola]|uniref:Uncharacterized protein n=1 Tax=Frigoriglobus tundricola TaxID=2774151 RepID=A0A6M5YXZ3_9BACT|nr:hypothetical protein FTUN_6582 [Frigoriglobus tundricola]